MLTSTRRNPSIPILQSLGPLQDTGMLTLPILSLNQMVEPISKHSTNRRTLMPNLPTQPTTGPRQNHRVDATLVRAVVRAMVRAVARAVVVIAKTEITLARARSPDPAMALKRALDQACAIDSTYPKEA